MFRSLLPSFSLCWYTRSLENDSLDSRLRRSRDVEVYTYGPFGATHSKRAVWCSGWTEMKMILCGRFGELLSRRLDAAEHLDGFS